MGVNYIYNDIIRKAESKVQEENIIRTSTKFETVSTRLASILDPSGNFHHANVLTELFSFFRSEFPKFEHGFHFHCCKYTNIFYVTQRILDLTPSASFTISIFNAKSRH